jgi:hypothetical protein
MSEGALVPVDACTLHVCTNLRSASDCRYLGPPNDYVAMKNLSNYNTTASPERVHGWWPSACSTAWNYICEVPTASYQCPPSPPQSPAPPPDIYACEQLTRL